MLPLAPATQRFILHWGEMGTRWGINRTMAQIHALLFVSEKPLPAEMICEVLGVARSNVSTSLRELQNWDLVKVVHLLGDRRDHFETLRDVYEMFRVIAQGRKKREMDPAMSTLKECIEQTDDKNPDEAYMRAQLEELRAFFELTSSWADKMTRMSGPRLRKALKLGDKAFSLLGLGD